MKPQAMIFDYDGTLVHLNIDFAAMRHAVEAILSGYGIQCSALRAAHVLELIQEAREQLASRHPTQAHALYREALATVAAHEIGAARTGMRIPGVERVLGNLRRTGVKVGVITRNCERAVRILFPSVDQLCDAFVPRDATVHVKPHPGQLTRVLQTMGIRHGHDALMVGDHPLDIQAGKRMHMKTVGVLTGNSTYQQLRDAGADWILDDVTHIETWFPSTHPTLKEQW